MKTKLLILFFSLVFLNSLYSQEYDEYRLSHKVEPTYQFIHLNLNPDKDVYSGTTKIELDVIEPLSGFRLMRLKPLSHLESHLPDMNCWIELYPDPG